MAEYEIYIPFSPSNYDYFDTSNNEHFYVKSVIEGSQGLMLYKNSAEINRLDKTDFLTYVGNITGVYRSNVSVTDLAVTIEYNKIPDFNYVFISEFNRYYFVTDITIIRYNLYEISLSIDVLMSYKDSLLNLYAFVDRNENIKNDYVVDNKRVIEQGANYRIDTVTNDLFDVKNGQYVLTGLLLATHSNGG